MRKFRRQKLVLKLLITLEDSSFSDLSMKMTRQERSLSSVDSSLLIRKSDRKTQPDMVRIYLEKKTVNDNSNRSDEVLFMTPSTWMTPTRALDSAGAGEEGRADELGFEGEVRGEGKLAGQLIIRLKYPRYPPPTALFSSIT